MNPYLKEFNKIEQKDIFSFTDYNEFIKQRSRRMEMVRKYSWSIPTDEAISAICKYSPIIELGAGTGYWASLIHQSARIECYDSHPPGILTNDYEHVIQYYPVMPIEWIKWDKTRNKSLFMSWPPYDDDMAINSLLKYRGKTLIYIGEGEYGCTANELFFKEREKNWSFVEEVELPQWDGIHDNLEIYRRK